MLATMSYAQTWHGLSKSEPSTVQTTLVSSSEEQIVVKLEIPGFFESKVTTPRGEASVISVPRTVSTFEAGEPALPVYGIPAIIGDKANMKVYVKDMKYTDYEDMEIAPSKGDFPRSIDPASVPFTYGEAYGRNEFFPAIQVGLHEPYIIRDLRGQNMITYPFAYNPVTKTLRVYHEMTLVMYKNGNGGANQIESRRSNTLKLDPDFKSLYSRHFINFEETMTKYTPLDEEGDLLIICYGNYISSMTDFVNWKNTRGVKTTIVNSSTAGSSYSAIKTYIQNQYNANNNLTHVLLVGDVAQIPGYTYSGASGYTGKGDNPYGQIVGNDIYNDVIIGRFSASSATQVATQANRTITYERDLTSSASWCQNGLGISASAGNGGHYNEDDYQHIENLRTDLLNYGYSTVYQDYKSVNGYPSSTTTTISNHINSGVGIINYCNHGEETGWQSHYYMNSNVNALTNDNKLPFIFSVACLVGQYDYSGGDCFAETWMHATNGSNPTGAIAGAFSYISQPWIPPMWAQDEFVDILIESYNSNIKHTFGGAAINGMMGIFDNYSTSTSSAVGTYQAWIIYGDPTLMMRTKTPQNMTVTHEECISTSATSLTVNVTNGNGAMVCLTDDYEIVARATVTNGSATLTFPAFGNNHGTLRLCVFGYNKVKYLTEICTVSGTASEYTINVSANPTNGGTVTGGGTYSTNTTRTVTATANTGYTFTNWTENGNVVSTNASYSFTLNYDRNLVANFAVRSYTVNAEANPTEGGSVALAQGGKSNRATLTYDFENGLQGWTILKGNTGNSPNNWMHNTAYPTGNNDFSTGYGHNNSDGFMLSESYISGSSSGSGSAVTPDNYLISPQVTLGGSISFYAGARNTDYCEEKFSVMVSTTNNTNTNSFTTIETYTLSLSAAGYTSSPYTIDLSAYSGMGYVAIRHWGCNDQWFLCIDDVTIVEGEYVDPGTASGTFTHGQTCIATATPNTNYQFVNWTENGSVVSSNATYSFSVTANRNLVANFSNTSLQTYTVTLNAGTGGTITPSGTQVVSAGSSLTFTVNANQCYQIANVTVNGATVTLSANNTYTITNIQSNKTVNVTFNYDNSCSDCNVYNDFSIEACESYTWNNQTYTQSGNYTQTFPIGGDDPDPGIVGDEFYYDFDTHPDIYNDDEMEGWYSYNINNTDSNDTLRWYFFEQEGYGYNGSNNFIGSQSYANGVDFTPDHLIVMPSAYIGSTSTLTLYARGYSSGNYSAEHFGVFVTTNADYEYVSDFTLMDDWTTTNDWTQYSVDLSEFAGQNLIIGLRHYDCYGQNYLFVDDIRLSNGTAKSTPMLVASQETVGERPSLNRFASLPMGLRNITADRIVRHTETTRSCDSIVTLHLTINPTYTNITDSRTFCQNELPFTWQGHVFNSAGSFTTNVHTVKGCDSIVTMTVSVNPTYSQSVSLTINEDQLPYTWQGYTFNAAGTHTANLQTTAGCDSIVTLTLLVEGDECVPTSNTINETACDSYTFNGATYTSSDIIEWHFTNAAGCDSTLTLNLTINASPVVTIDSEGLGEGGTATLVASGANNYLWSTGETTASITVSPSQTTTYTVAGTDANGCTGTAQFTVYVDGIEEAASIVSVFPNPVEQVVTVKANSIERIRLFDITGQMLLDSTESGDTATIDMSGFAIGQYILQVSTKNNVATQKLIKK